MAVLALSVVLGVPAAASAQTDPYVKGNEEVRNQDAARDPVVSSESASNSGTGASDSSDSSGTLPVTGGDLVGLTVIGLGALGAGTFLVRRSRTRSTA